jgi:uncharacterized membrane protein YhiD involved in acid resistance
MAPAFLPPAVFPCRFLGARRATSVLVTASLVDLRSLAVAAILVLSPSATLPPLLREPTPIAMSAVPLAQKRTADDSAAIAVKSPAGVMAAVQGHAPLAVVGVSKVRIHDLGTPPEASPDVSLSASRQRAALRAAQTSALRDDPEMAIAARLIPAVLLGALLGTERAALSHGFCVRTLLLVSSVSALATVSGLASGLALPPALPAVMLAGATALGAVSVAAATVPLSSSLSSSRGVDRVRGRHRATTTVLAVAAATATLGAACGAGLPLVAALGYLLAVAVLRLDARAADVLAGHRGFASSSKRAGGRHRSTRPRLRRKRMASGDALAAGALVTAAVSSGKAGHREPPTAAESDADSVGPFLFGLPQPQPPHPQDETHPPAGRTVLRLAMENSGGAQRIVEVAGSDLDDAIRELKRREWS